MGGQILYIEWYLYNHFVTVFKICDEEWCYSIHQYQIKKLPFYFKKCVYPLPTHQPWNCAIDLLMNTSLLNGWVYPCPTLNPRQWKHTLKRHWWHVLFTCPI